jgi:hypothetical protein
MAEKFAVFTQTVQSFYGFIEKANFRRKLSKIAENCEQNIDAM